MIVLVAVGIRALWQVDDIGGAVVLVGAVIGSLGVIWSKVFRPVLALGRKLSDGADVVFGLEDWRFQVERRFDTLDDRHTKLVERIDDVEGLLVKSASNRVMDRAVDQETARVQRAEAKGI